MTEVVAKEGRLTKLFRRRAAGESAEVDVVVETVEHLLTVLHGRLEASACDRQTRKGDAEGESEKEEKRTDGLSISNASLTLSLSIDLGSSSSSSSSFSSSSSSSFSSSSSGTSCRCAGIDGTGGNNDGARTLLNTAPAVE